MAQHASDCSVHNEPAYPAGPCDCGADVAETLKRARAYLSDAAKDTPMEVPDDLFAQIDASLATCDSKLTRDA